MTGDRVRAARVDQLCSGLKVFFRSWRQTAFSSATVLWAQVSKITFTRMPGDWAYDELLPIGEFELTILGRAAPRLHRVSHWSFPLRC
jgi:hypothetical protein